MDVAGRERESVAKDGRGIGGFVEIVACFEGSTSPGIGTGRGRLLVGLTAAKAATGSALSTPLIVVVASVTTAGRGRPLAAAFATALRCGG